MRKNLKRSLFGRLSILLAILMILPIVAPVYAGENPTKSVVISNVPDHYKLSVGKGEGMTVGTKGTIVRDGNEIAKFEVTSVDWGYSEVKVSGLAKGDMIRIGDSAEVSSSGSSEQKVKNSGGGGKALLALLIVGAVVALGGRHGGGGASSPASTKSISLSSLNTSLPADGKSTTTVTANIVDGNNAAVADGTAVQFSANGGSISPAQATTTAGKATAVLTAGTSAGPVTVTATSSGKTSTTIITMTPSTGAVGSIELASNQTSIQVLGSGGTTTQATITATCRDAQGSLATSGTVIFTSTLGSVVGTATINSSGVATSTFSSSATGQAQITATWAAATASLAVSVTAGPPFAINVTCTPGAIQCDGHSFANVTATVKDIAGNMVTDGTVVSFSVQPDVNGGGNGTVTPEGRTTAGVATASLFSRNAAGTASNPGAATVVAKVLVGAQPSGIPVPAANLDNHATQVQFTSLDVAEIHVGATVSNVRGLDMVNNTTTIVAVLYDSHHNPVPDGTAVYFTSTHGMIYGNAGVAGNVALSTTSLGKASATLATDASYSPSWNGFVDITTTSGNVSTLSPGLVVFSGWPDAPSHATISPDTISKVKGQALITVYVLDVNGNPVVDGTKVTLRASLGTIDIPSPTTVGGAVSVTLKTSDDANNPTPTGLGAVSISIDSGGYRTPWQIPDLVYTVN